MTNNRIYIYSPSFSSRLQYVIGEIFENQLGLKVLTTSDKLEFYLFNIPKLSYGEFINDTIPFIGAHGLLEEKDITNQNPKVSNFNEVPVIFQLKGDMLANLPYDPLAAVFYMLTRYEEYLLYKADKLGRFSASQSLAFKNDFLNKPVVQLWVNQIKEILKEYYPEIHFKKQLYSFTASFDIDVAYAYKKRDFSWMFFSISLDILKFNYKNIFNRILVLMGLKRDPYDTYKLIYSIVKKEDIDTHFFIHCGNYFGRKDRSLIRNTAFWKRFIANMSKFGDVGIHPSYSSNNNEEHFNEELSLFKEVSPNYLKTSRQHYLKIKFPNTYRNLLYAGIKNDYTMGFADQCGFRAGTCMPFYFYDLDLEMTSSLKVHPFVIMDGTLKEYMKLNQEQSLQLFDYYKNEIKNVGGNFTILCHNNTFSNFAEWENWKHVFIKMLREGVV